MKQFKLFYDQDKENKYLKEMCDKGWALKNFKYGLYTFEPCTPGQWQYDSDLNDRGFILSKEYREFLKEMDIELISTSGFWFLVRRKSSYGPLQLYTSKDSRIKQLKKIRNMFKVTAIIELICMFLEVLVAIKLKSWGFSLIALILFILFFTLSQAAFTYNTLNK